MNVTADLVAEVVERVIPHIAFDLRPDVLAAMERAAAAEEDPRGKLVLEQLLENSRIAAADRVPLCQDTGMAVVFADLGQDVKFLQPVAVNITSTATADLKKEVADKCTQNPNENQIYAITCPEKSRRAVKQLLDDRGCTCYLITE